MANFCSNSIVFYSKDKQKLSVFLRKIYAAFDSQGSGIYNLMVLHGYKDREILNSIDKRDCFTFCDSKLRTDKDIYSFQVDEESAWVPHMEVFRKILRQKYGNAIRMVFLSEECGNDIYINTDTEGKYFTERYKVECSHGKEYKDEYFSEYSDLIRFVNEEYGTDLTEFDDVEDVESRVRLLNGEDEYFKICRFTSDYQFNGEREVA